MSIIIFDGKDFIVSDGALQFKLSGQPDGTVALKGEYKIDSESLSRLLAAFNKDVCVTSMLIPTPSCIYESIHVNPLNASFIREIRQMKAENERLKRKIDEHNESGIFGRMKEIYY